MREQIDELIEIFITTQKLINDIDFQFTYIDDVIEVKRQNLSYFRIFSVKKIFFSWVLTIVVR